MLMTNTKMPEGRRVLVESIYKKLINLYLKKKKPAQKTRVTFLYTPTSQILPENFNKCFEKCCNYVSSFRLG